MNTEAYRVKFDAAKRERLRKAHKKALKDKKDQFTFEGHEYLTRFAGYVLEYLDMKSPE